MEYEITQIISYLVTAETPDEALDKWDNHPRTGVIEWSDEDVALIDERIEVNG